MWRVKYDPVVSSSRTMAQGASSPVLKKRKLEVKQVKAADVASARSNNAVATGAVFNAIDAAQKQGKHRVVISPSQDYTREDIKAVIYKLMNVGFRVQEVSKGGWKYVVHWKRGMMMWGASK